MKDKKLVILTSSFYPNKGGVEKHLENVVKILALRGYQVTVLVRYARGFPKVQKVFGVTVRRMPKNLSLYSMKLWVLRNKELFNGAVVHSHDFFPFTLRHILHSTRWVHTFHGYEGYPLNPNDIKSRQQVADSVDYTFCVGEFIEKWYGTKCDSVLYGAALEEKVKSSVIKWDFIFYGRFEEDTGFESYIKAFERIQQNNPKLTMIVVGNGSKLKWAQAYIKEKNLNITLHNTVIDINEHLHGSRVAFVSGYLSIIECALAKKQIVAYYGTPIKKDYLECHPMASNMSITGSVKGIYEAGILALKDDGKRIENMYNWAISQTWDNLVNHYEGSYKITDD